MARASGADSRNSLREKPAATEEVSAGGAQFWRQLLPEGHPQPGGPLPPLRRGGGGRLLAVGGSAVPLLAVWLVVRMAMPILIERMSA